MEQVAVRLEDLLVDPRLSPRRCPVDAEHLEHLVAAAREETLPPLQVARIASASADWCGCANIASKRSRAEFEAETAGVPFCHRPLRPGLVLFDGLTVYWALRATGQTEWPALLAEKAVAGPNEVRLLALVANLRHGRKLTDFDVRDAFALLWLGRPVRPTHENWRPERGALDLEEVAQRLGKSVAWASRIRTQLEVCYRVKLDLRLAVACELSHLPGDRWWSVCWEGDELRTWARLDDQLRPIACEPPRTICQMTADDVARLVRREMQSADPGASGGGAERQPAHPKLPLVEQDHYQGELPGLWDDVNERVRPYAEAAARFDADQVRQAAAALRPVRVEVNRAWEALLARGKRLGVEV